MLRVSINYILRSSL